MSLSSGLNAGVAGLSVNSTRLAVISDNIANAVTSEEKSTSVRRYPLVFEFAILFEITASRVELTLSPATPVFRSDDKLMV